MEEEKIKSIEIGIGDDSVYFSTNKSLKAGNPPSPYYVDEIRVVRLMIGKGYYNDLSLDHVQVYKDGKMVMSTPVNNPLLVISY